jgi:hypothetical protein
MAGVAHQPVERPVKDHRNRGALVRMQRQLGQRRKTHPGDEQAIHVSAAGCAAAKRDGDMSGGHRPSSADQVVAFVPSRSISCKTTAD